MKAFKRSLIRNIVIAGCSVIAVFSIYLIIDYTGPAKIHLRQDNAFGMSCLKANDLIVQEYDAAGNLWATRGMTVYSLAKGESFFEKEAHIPTGFSVFWLRNFTLLRRLTVRPECVEMVAGTNGEICALSAGKLWYYDKEIRKFVKALTIEHYGFGDQGTRNNGILRTNDSTIYFAEYFQNFEREEVHIYESCDNGLSWQIVHTFPAGTIRHIHAIQKDPYTGRLWICTGDSDEESMIAYSDDGFRTIVKAGSGGQEWRVCQLVFTEDGIYWGTDTSNSEEAGIYKIGRLDSKLIKLASINDMIFFGTRLHNGTIVISSNRQGSEIETDDRTRLYTVDNNQVINIANAGTWNFNQPGFRFKYAQLRFQRNQGSEHLAMTVLNQKEFTDGDLIILAQDELKNIGDNGNVAVTETGKKKNSYRKLRLF